MDWLNSIVNFGSGLFGGYTGGGTVVEDESIIPDVNNSFQTPSFSLDPSSGSSVYDSFNSAPVVSGSVTPTPTSNDKSFWNSNLFSDLALGGIKTIGGYLANKYQTDRADQISNTITPLDQAKLDFQKAELAQRLEIAKMQAAAAGGASSAAAGANEVARKRNIAQAYAFWAAAQNEAGALRQKALENLGQSFRRGR